MMNNYFFPLRLSSSSFFFFLPSPITFFIILSFSLSLSLSPSLSLHRLLEPYHVITSREKSKDRIERVSIRVKQNSGSRATFFSLSLSRFSISRIFCRFAKRIEARMPRLLLRIDVRGYTKYPPHSPLSR